MKKITQSATTGGAPIYLDDFKDVFNLELWDVLQAQFSAFDSDIEGIIVSGCDITGSVGNYTLSAGIVYIDGEFRRIAQSTGLSLPQYIIASTDVNTTRTFEDTVVKTLFVTKGAELDTSAPGSGQYVAITTTTDPDDRRFKATAVKTKVIEIGDWNMDTTASVNVTHGIGNYKSIRSVTAVVRDDSDTTYSNISSFTSGTGAIAGGIGQISSTTINVGRLTGGDFDGVAYDATGFNRGWITIIYEG